MLWSFCKFTHLFDFVELFPCFFCVSLVFEVNNINVNQNDRKIKVFIINLSNCKLRSRSFQLFFKFTDPIDVVTSFEIISKYALPQPVYTSVFCFALHFIKKKTFIGS